MVKVDRSEALDQVCRAQLERLTAAERAEQLESMTFERWDNDPAWPGLPEEVREEFEEGDLLQDPASSRYDAVLLIWLRSRLAAASNSYLLDLLREAGGNATEIIGAPIPRESCPCCGLRSIGRRSSYAICRVCWWEDDGQDNTDADTVMGGPNYSLSLTQGRVNFLVKGISDPSREDLRKLQEPPEKYELGRVFVLSDDLREVSEPSANWSSAIPRHWLAEEVES